MSRFPLLALPADQACFSVYNLLNPASVLNIFTEKPRILAFWSHRIERAILDYNLETDVFVGFQKLSRFAPVLPQYQHIAHQSTNTWVFGTGDASYPELASDLNFVHLQPTDKLYREWFLVVNTPTYTRALVARELTDPDDPADQRQFEGILTSDVRVVSELVYHLHELTARLQPTGTVTSHDTTYDNR